MRQTCIRHQENALVLDMVCVNFLSTLMQIYHMVINLKQRNLFLIWLVLFGSGERKPYLHGLHLGCGTLQKSS